MQGYTVGQRYNDHLLFVRDFLEDKQSVNLSDVNLALD